MSKVFTFLFTWILFIVFPACTVAPSEEESSTTSTGTKAANITISATNLQSSRESISATSEGDYLFSNQIIDTATVVALTLYNTGDIAADKIKAYSLSGPLSYAGGSYPGIGGTCTTKIPGQGSCTVVVSFSPTKIGTNSTSLKLGYYNGKTTRTFEQLFKGVGISSPQISSLSPSAGGILGGRTMTIVGTQLFAGATVKVGGETCTVTSQTEPTLILCTLPPHAVGAVDVVVTNSDNRSATSVNAFTYQLAPTVTSLGTTYGRASGGTTITVNGTGFITGASVVLGGQSCTSVSVNSLTQLTCVTPAHAIGTVDIMVMNADGQYGSLSNVYTYYNIPAISSITPDYGTQDGGTQIIISGSEFIVGATVTIGGYSCNSISVDSQSQITCTTPPQSVGSYDVVVTNTNTYSGTAMNAYDYTVRSEAWQAITTLGAPANRKFHLAVWTGSKMIIWGGYLVSFQTNTGGQYDPVTDSWTSTSTVNAPPRRIRFDGVWSGQEMFVWGGDNGGGINTGGRYDPIANSWVLTTTLGAPSARYLNAVTWTGSKLLIWGGETDYTNMATAVNTGGYFDPSSNSWTATTTTSSPSPRMDEGYVWAGNRMLIWGGTDATGTRNDGAFYDLSLDSWTSLSTLNAPPRRTAPFLFWTGDKALVWGGTEYTSFLVNTGGLYSPASDSWSQTSTVSALSARGHHWNGVWTGSKMFIWGDFSPLNTGGMYDPLSNSWTATTTLNTPQKRRWFSAVWTGAKAIIWGGEDSVGTGYFNTGAIYTPAGDAASNSWTTMTTTGAPSERTDQSMVWTGSKVLVWGGWAGGVSNSGGVYDPITNSWTSMTTTGAPIGRTLSVCAWTGTKMLVWGGLTNSSVLLNDGGAYDPVSNIWTAIAQPAGLNTRLYHSGIWSGSKFIVWGGYTTGFTNQNSGGVYDPSNDTWAYTSTTNAPAIRYKQSAVWTASKMIIWGGNSAGGAINTGGVYDLASDTWINVTTTNAPEFRLYHAAHWTGSNMLIWGGMHNVIFNNGGQYNPVTNSWVNVSTINAPSPRAQSGSVWVNNQMIVLGGAINRAQDSYAGDGASYDPTANVWKVMSTLNIPSTRYSRGFISIGTKALIWGGTASSGSYCYNSGGIYTP